MSGYVCLIEYEAKTTNLRQVNKQKKSKKNQKNSINKIFQKNKKYKFFWKKI